MFEQLLDVPQYTRKRGRELSLSSNIGAATERDCEGFSKRLLPSSELVLEVVRQELLVARP